jgi:hypothetical protein
MTPEQAELAGALAVGIAALWAVYGLLSSRIEQHARDLNEVRANYVRRDDFLRVIDRFEAKLDEHLRLAAGKRPPPPA